jgi:hypothetical protein
MSSADSKKQKYLEPYEKNHTKLEKALKQAHEIRIFEIDLYWKRAAYFWTFIAVAFTGYSLLEKEHVENSHLDFTLQFTAACVGFLFSLAWYCVNRGGNFWQKNWEAHVDLLEDEVMGPLYKTVLTTKPSFCNLTDAYHFSPSKINHVLSLVVSGVWIYLVCHTIIEAWPAISGRNILTIIIIGALTIIGGAFILYQTSSNEDIAISISTRKITEDPS